MQIDTKLRRPSMQQQVRDLLKKPIVPGKKIVYAVREGGKGNLKIGNVISLTEDRRIKIKNEEGKIAHLNFPERCAIVEENYV